MNYQNVTFEKSFGQPEQLESSDLPEICFSGRSNVGKSSLINKLVGRKALARVSTKPGKTVTINFFRLDGIRLCDLPGYGYAKVSFAEKQRWSGLMEHYFAAGRDIKMVFQLVDMRHAATRDDVSMIEYLMSTGYPFCVVLTKSDKLNKSEREQSLETFREQFKKLPKGTPIVPFSAVTGEGVDALKKIIEESIENKSFT